MKRIYFTITGTNHYFGHEFFEPKMTVRLVKEPDNIHDAEAIRVEAEGLGKVGYVANSTYTTAGISWSAGRIYDKIGKTAEGTVMYKLPRNVLCYINEDSVIGGIPDEDEEKRTGFAGKAFNDKPRDAHEEEEEEDDDDDDDDRGGFSTDSVCGIRLNF